MFYFQSYVTKKPTCVILNVNGSPKKINVDKIEKELLKEMPALDKVQTILDTSIIFIF